MNGAEHYIEAERLVRQSSWPAVTAEQRDNAASLAAQAQVHATLALIAGVMSSFTSGAAMAALADLVTE